MFGLVMASAQKRVDPSPREVLVLVGPTASGKTEVSLQLARILGGEIISADSRQVYRHLDIGTAKPSVEQRAEIQHYFIDDLLPDQPFSAGAFGTRGRQVIDRILDRAKVPIVVGGSGLYVKALVDGLFDGPGADQELRKVWEQQVKNGRSNELVEQLRAVDPESAARADLTKPRRIVRALEVYHLTGKPISLHHREGVPSGNFVAHLFGLDWERNELYRRIENRCEEMIQNGLLAEIEHLEELGYDRRLNALSSVGYAEGFAYRAGEISHAEMVPLFKQNSRRYAKRQLTWFRAEKRIRWLARKGSLPAGRVAEDIAKKFEELLVTREIHC